MTVSAQTLAFEYAANGVTTTFPYGFRVLYADQVKVYVNGTLQVGGYTLTGVGDAGGGNVEFSVAPVNGSTVLVRRISDRVRSTDFQQAPYFTQEELLDIDQDYQTMLLQEASADAINALRIPAVETNLVELPDAATRANKFLVFNGNGDVGLSEGSGNNPTTYYAPTKSAGDTLASSLPDGATVITDEDEAATPAGVQTRRSVLSGALTAIASFLKTGMIAWKHGGTGAVWRTLYARLMDLPISVKDFGAKGNGSNDDTAAIQLAFDSTGLAPIYFPAGTYKITGTGAACLTLTKNKSLYGEGRSSILRADSVGAETSLLKIAITDNGGYGDVRGWRMDNISTFFNGGGKHGLHIEGGLSIIASHINMCVFSKGNHADGHGIYIYDQLSHSEISLSQFDTAYMKCFDANVIRKCLTFGRGAAITFDCEEGVRNNTVRDCTIVNRDGQIVIENGDNIRIINNQFELAQGLTPSSNQSTYGAMVWLKGTNRTVINTIIEENNFGGGTNLERLIYVDNATGTVIDKNYLISVNTAEIEFSANAKYNFVGSRNLAVGSISNPRNRTLFKAKVIDAGVGNMGVLGLASSIAATDWTGSDFWKDDGGVVRFIGGFQAGTLTAGTIMAQMPVGFRPYIQNDTVKRNLLTYTEQANNAAWVASSLGITADVALSPDSRGTADLAFAGASTALHALFSPKVSLLASTAYAFSWYLKRTDGSSASSVRLEVNDDSSLKYMRVNVNVAAGTTGGVNPNGTYWVSTSVSIEDAGAGWWRVVVLGTTTASGATSSCSIGVSPNNVASIYTSYLGDPAVHNVLVWGAQIEPAATASLYQRVEDALTFKTPFKTIALPAVSAAGTGYVTLSGLGVMKVGSLPSSSDVLVSSYQASDIQT